jgi:hypothetical protein
MSKKELQEQILLFAYVLSIIFAVYFSVRHLLIELDDGSIRDVVMNAMLPFS